jgi:hypothetical protein
MSLFHVALPVVLVWAVRRAGYDRRAPWLQLALAAPVLVASRLMGPAENPNFAFADPFFGRAWGPAPLHLAVILGGLAVIYGITHLALRRIAAAPGAAVEKARVSAAGTA